jgi:hypothetical protein
MLFRDQQTQAIDPKILNVFPYGMGGMNPGVVVGIKKPEDGKAQPGIRNIMLILAGMPKGYGIPMMMPNGVNQQMLSMFGGGFAPPGVQAIPLGNGMMALMMPVQMDKSQQPNQGTGFPGVATMGGLPNLGSMFPLMGPGGIPQGVLMSPSMLNQNPQLQQQQQQAVDKTKAAEQEKQKQSGKKEDKKDTFPPQVMQPVDLN